MLWFFGILHQVWAFYKRQTTRQIVDTKNAECQSCQNLEWSALSCSTCENANRFMPVLTLEALSINYAYTENSKVLAWSKKREIKIFNKLLMKNDININKVSIHFNEIWGQRSTFSEGVFLVPAQNIEQLLGMQWSVLIITVLLSAKSQITPKEMKGLISLAVYYKLILSFQIFNCSISSHKTKVCSF